MEIDMTLKTGKKFRKQSMFGVGWGISFGAQNTKTESYLGLWSYQQDIQKNGWGNLNFKSEMSLEEVRKDPMKAQATAIPETGDAGLWIPVVTEFTPEDAIRIAAKRQYKTRDESRNLKLGEKRKFAAGFFDAAGPFAFSEVMELPLDSGFGMTPE
jgi:hypothetical protein